MLNVSFFVNSKNEMCGFEISGHAEYARYNKDIVCAAVSSAAYMTSNIITSTLKIKARVKVDEGYMYVRVPDKDIPSCSTILEGFKLHLLGLQKSYPRNIKAVEEVV